MGLVPKQFLTVALGGDANPRAFGRTLFRLGFRLKLVSQGGIQLIYTSLETLRQADLVLQFSGRIAAERGLDAGQDSLLALPAEGLTDYPPWTAAHALPSFQRRCRAR